ncbi:MAG: antibiotic biosynthesis monooxygenase [Candidatus Omnitrophica bacterium CG11_big_fil_rev_8_21_14_0_20_45_26]|uniref:Antibiotic biosynthesis monooxygenase n=1 Tax=Candidatus Abzuiibacterium crystallinum TaxID=1974748 RepID=A0A2H0LU18_9BACT|nr:MAG: antibiotic biosynthesis monooxygenase [Candidatus Omnitrophica bacterium CG11_big_fil_rev_8_21_14_0_20_45_26]PIW64569.1 MAG: antibiotic biosynthesis monooxygenase [Candidatus Omnitrophica bacterium CG12_big_fil_rev_8_21_14_0_65_45_16]
MKDKPITVVARIRAKQGKEAQVREALLGLVGPTHAEAGCLQYDLHQSKLDPALFLFYENWSSQKALDQHFKTPHLLALGAKADVLFAEPVSITAWEMISSPKAAAGLSS